MRKGKVFEKFKKIIISIMCVITLIFAMPVKSEAGIVADFVNLLLGIPDAIMWGMNQLIAKTDASTSVDMDFKDWGGQGYIYNFEVTPYKIFSTGSYKEEKDPDTGEVLYYETDLGLFDANFFSDKEIQSKTIVSSNILKYAIGNIYKYLRNLCMVLMMLVLLYIGIKIIISSSSQQQSKYKQMLTDWLVGMCLLMMMHYIMSFLMNINSTIVKMLSNEEGDSYYMGLSDLQDNGKGTDSSWLDIATGREPWGWGEDKYEQRFFGRKVIIKNTDDDTDGFDVDEDGYVDLSTEPWIMYKNKTNGTNPELLENWGKNGKLYLSAVLMDHDNPENKNRAIYKANLMEYTRTISNFGLELVDNVYIYSNGSLQHLSGEYGGLTEELPAFAYSILYLALVVETVMFTIVYIKRVLQLAMLTMIAPLVAFMYPIDKIGDGQAQAFNTWFKDYMFNILIQPLHLLLYTIFIVAASDLFQKNIIYAIAIYAFMIPAEKYFKKIFGFDKASSGGGGPIAGALGAGMAMDGLRRLTGLGPPPPPGAPGGGNKTGGSQGNKIKIKKRDPKKDESNIKKSSNGNENGSEGGPLPGALPNGKSNGVLGRAKNSVKNTGKAAVGTGKRKVARALTGGKYNKMKGNGKRFWAAAGKNIIGKGIKGGTKLAVKAGTTAALTGAGILAGTATAIATGDVNNLTKGVAIGAAAGWKNGKGLANWGGATIGNFANEVKATRAENDEEYAGKIRAEQAKAEFENDLTEEQEAIINKYAPMMDFNGDEDKLKAVMEADSLGYSEEQIKQAESDSKSWKDLKTNSDHTSYVDFQTKERMDQIDEYKIEISQDEIEKQAKLDKQARVAEANKQRKESESKYDGEIAKARQARNTKRVKELERERTIKDRELENKVREEQASKYNREEAENKLREQKKQEMAREQAEEDYQKALRFQQTSKKTSK